MGGPSHRLFFQREAGVQVNVGRLDRFVTVELVGELAPSLSDALIAGLLNRLGQITAKGHGWTRSRLRSLRNSHGIAVYRAGERQVRSELVLPEAAQRLGVDLCVESHSTSASHSQFPPAAERERTIRKHGLGVEDGRVAVKWASEIRH